jgi:glycosyltransferase involved in cell wall biosynthesis
LASQNKEDEKMSDLLGQVRHPRAAERPLRIAMVAPPWFEVPPLAYGGIESVVADLVDGLVARGHEVVLIAAGRARTKAQRFVATYDEPPSGRLGDPMPEVRHIAAAAKALESVEVDIVHDHTLAGPLLARARRAPTVVTAHGPVSGEPGNYLAELGDSIEVVAISHAQARERDDINWVATIHNAIDVDSFPLGAGNGGYVLFLGRFNPDKGAHLAIDAARKAERRILLAGKLNEAAEHAYFEAEIQPRLGPGVEYVGEADAKTKRELLAGAESLLFPVCWQEPFGIVMIEAMACGTPVVALGRGSVPEVVTDGETGIVVSQPFELPAAIEAATRIDRRTCRAHAKARFDVPVMVAKYEAVYRTLVEGRELLEEARLDHTGGDDLVSAGPGGSSATEQGARD